MSIVRCDSCSKALDTDFVSPYEYETSDGALCESCYIEREDTNAERVTLPELDLGSRPDNQGRF